MEGVVPWWEQRQLRILVVASLSLQYFLFFTAGIRNIYALGTLSTRARTQLLVSRLLVLILLLILLGEDNQLWMRRHAVTTASQVSTAVYVFWKSLPEDSEIFELGVALFSVGILINVFKLRCMYVATIRNTEEPVEEDAEENAEEGVEEVEDAEENAEEDAEEVEVENAEEIVEWDAEENAEEDEQEAEEEDAEENAEEDIEEAEEKDAEENGEEDAQEENAEAAAHVFHNHPPGCCADNLMPGLQGYQVAPEVMLPLEFLKNITNDFSKEQELGRGTFGTVYKGEQNGKEIAVKLLHRTQRQDHEEEFRKEFENLRRLKHPNIVQLLGYCNEIKREFVAYEGRHVFADNIYRALCFEYMPNGSLQGRLHDEFHGLDWQTRYKIIKGICEGLKYLHEGLESPMYHLDLKPGNILLGKDMVPKLADFGLSKLVCNNHTQSTKSIVGTIKYCPPEYIEQKYVSNKFDIFSLGVVMIETIAGSEGYRKTAEMLSQEFIDHVQENWRKRLQATQGYNYKSIIYECHQVKRCIEIALDCVLPDRKHRPNIGDITSWLNETEHNVITASRQEIYHGG